MLILSIRTDKPESEIGIFNDQNKLSYQMWEAHRKLAETIHQKITDMLEAENYTLSDIEAIVCYKGPGSFTGLRIGLSVANALAYSLNVPIVGGSGEDWLEKSIAKIINGENEKQVLPEYGAPVHITKSKK